ncbi:MAG: cytochrome c3 family protein [Phycisphaerae bacterium]
MCAACAGVLPACYAPVRYRVLTLFFDGVPQPGSRPAVGYATPSTEMPRQGIQPSDVPLSTSGEVHAHPPYRDNKCGSCHNTTTGQLYRTPKEGLCQGCHTDIPGQVRYVHGPVAVRECLFCHHFHTSPYPKVLLRDATSTCFRCHRRADLAPGPHRDTIDHQSCVACHNPHGGSYKYFLRRAEP